MQLAVRRRKARKQSLDPWQMPTHQEQPLTEAVKGLSICTGKDLTSCSVGDGLEGKGLKGLKGRRRPRRSCKEEAKCMEMV